MKDKIKFICERLRCSTYSDNAVDYVEEKLLSMTDENLINKYLLDISILVIKGYNLGRDPYHPDSVRVNIWDKEYDEICNEIIKNEFSTSNR